MRRLLLAFLVVAIVPLLSGCIEVEDEFTLNPDGSGKVKHHIVFIPKLINFGRTPDDPDKVIKKAIREEIKKSKGVEAWKDVSYSLRDDGRIEFTGTAYFSDLNDLNLHNQGYEGPLSNMNIDSAKGGELKLTLQTDEKESSTPEGEKEGLSGEKLEKRMKLERAKFAVMKAMLAPMKDIKFTTRIHFPGPVSDASVFEKTTKNSARLVFRGKQIFDLMESLMKNDEKLKESLKKGQDPTNLRRNMGGKLTKLLFNREGPLSIRAGKGDGKEQFPYEKEVAQARKEMKSLRKTLGLAGSGSGGPGGDRSGTGSGSDNDKKEDVGVAKGGKFKSLNVGAVEITHLEARRGMRKGLQLTLVGEFPGRVRDVKDGMIEKAVSSSGEDLLQEGRFNRDIEFPRLNDAKTKVSFRVNLKYPEKELTGLKELSGTVDYTTGSKTKSVDIGIDKFKKGETGKKYNSQIKSIEPSRFDKKKKTLKLKTDLDKDRVKSFTFYDGDGNKLDVRRSGYSSFGGETTFRFRYEGEFPKNGKIEANVLTDLKKRELKFTLKDVNLFSPGK